MSKQAKEALMCQSDKLLREIIDSTNVFLKYLWEDKEQSDFGDLALVCMLREWIASVDAVALLIIYGRCEPAKAIIRTAFEITLQLLYLINENGKAEQKAVFYFVMSEMKKIDSNEKACKHNQIVGINIANDIIETKEMRESLEYSQYEDIRSAYNYISYQKNWDKKKWFYFCNDKIGGWNELCKEVRLFNGNTEILLYDTIYNILSMQAHGLSSADRIKKIDNLLQIEEYDNLRYLLVNVTLIHKMYLEIKNRLQLLYTFPMEKNEIEKIKNISAHLIELESAYNFFISSK